MNHVTVFHEPGTFAGWPANYGIWSWGDEIVVDFTAGTMDPSGEFHARTPNQPFRTVQARSLDGGTTWTIEDPRFPSPGGRALSADEHMIPKLHVGTALRQGIGPLPGPCPGKVDFTHPNFAMMCARTGLGPGTVAWFYLSQDRARTWEGPYSLPMFGFDGIEARTDYLVNGPRDCFLFLTARMEDEKQDSILCVHTEDGGISFRLKSQVVDGARCNNLMPASLRTPSGRILVAVRSRDFGEFTTTRSFIDLHVSEDHGATFRHLAEPVAYTGKGGNPPTLTLLPDGRIALVYGYRASPFGIRAKISADGGEHWGEEIILRQDGGCHDLGYPRTVLRPDGKLVTVYYYNLEEQGERLIGATIWEA